MYCQNCGNKLKKGILICPKCGFENKNKVKKPYVNIVIILILIAFGIVTYYGFTNKKLKQNFLYLIGIENKSFCEFEVLNIKEYRLGPNKDNVNSWYQSYISENNYPIIKDVYFQMWQKELIKRTIYYQAIIRNNSDKSHKLISINAKLLNNEGLVISERSTNPINKEIGPGQAIEFKTEVDLVTKDEVDKYFKNEYKDQNIVFYPWFEGCIY